MDFKKLSLIFLILLPPIIILTLRQFFEMSYLISSLYKLIFISPIIYRVFIYKKSFKSSLMWGFHKNIFKKYFINNLLVALGLGIIFLGGFFILRGYLDFSLVIEQLNVLIGVDKSNIILIGLYIIFINSLIEEFFWRGFIFKELKMNIFTAICFALYHLVFIYSWFSLVYIIIMFVGLTVFALIMNYTLQKKDLFSCWFIHALMDLVMIFIGLIIFGIIS